MVIFLLCDADSYVDRVFEFRSVHLLTDYLTKAKGQSALGLINTDVFTQPLTPLQAECDTK